MHNRKVYALLIGCTWMIVISAFGQDQKIADSLEHVYQQNNKVGIEKIKLLDDLSFNETKDLRKAVRYAEELIMLSKQAGNEKYLRRGYNNKGTKKRMLGEFEEALAAYLKSAEIAEKTNQSNAIGEAYSLIGDVYAAANNQSNAKLYYRKALEMLRQVMPKSYLDSVNFASVLLNAGDAFRRFKIYDSALFYFNEAKVIFDKTKYSTGVGYCLGNIGMVYAIVGKDNLAEKNIKEAIPILEKEQNYSPICDYLTSMADVYLKRGDTSASLNYLKKSLGLAEQYGLKEQIREASLKLSEYYEHTGEMSDALKTYKEYIVYRDILSSDKVQHNIDSLQHSYEISQKQIEINQATQKLETGNKLRIYLSIILGLAIIILVILMKNNWNRQKAYRVLNLQKQETEAQKTKAEDALTELQLTQKQLIQTAKMASLGELTAGIAHEIQNPLNFVNNFSDVSLELLDELEQEKLSKLPASDFAEAAHLVANLADNLKKIRDHGKRADSIVKGMLQHSRASTGKKEPTNINALADEYLRLSYHGLRAKDNTFNANFAVDFDASVDRIDAVPQDLGRLLLNLYNNAFYAVKEKTKQKNDAYVPLVSVTTKKVKNKVELSVKDNGTGIPQKQLDKIFQPFFTTKPPGEGTGLGLSLSYDIVKAHGGEFKVETKEGEFTEFIVQLPIGNGALS